MAITLIAESPEDMDYVSTEIRKTYPDDRIFTLSGDLGAGKTTFVKAFAVSLGLADEVSSPTFSLVHQYGSESLKVFHFDLYRITTVDELFQIGFEEYLEQGAYVFIEWPELAKEFLPVKYVNLSFVIENENCRKLLCSIVNNS